MASRNRIAAIAAAALAAGTLSLATPAHAFDTVLYTTESGTFELLTIDGSSFGIVGWSVAGACPTTLEIPSEFTNDDYATYDEETGEPIYPAIDSFTGSAFREHKCLTTDSLENVAGKTRQVVIPETVTVLPAGAFFNDYAIAGFEFQGESSPRPSVLADAFGCNLAACTTTPWHAAAFFDPANTTNWNAGDTWYGLSVRNIPTVAMSKPVSVARARQVVFYTVVTSNDAGTATVRVFTKVYSKGRWIKSNVCTTLVELAANTPTLVSCVAGNVTRYSLRKLRSGTKLPAATIVSFSQSGTQRVATNGRTISLVRVR